MELRRCGVLAGKLLSGCAIVRPFKESVSFGYGQEQQAPGVPDPGTVR